MGERVCNTLLSWRTLLRCFFGVQLGGGTGINSALAYCEKQVENPRKTHLLLITDLYEGGDAKSMLARAAAIKQSGINLIVLPALSDSGRPATSDVQCSPVFQIRCVARYAFIITETPGRRRGGPS